MTKSDFIEQIAKYVQKYAPKYNIAVCSPIIAQACLESGYGTSAKAKYHNYFGLKYRPNRVTCNNGYFSDGSAEQNTDGSYINISTNWFSFENMEKGVEGYFQFTNTANYSNLKGVTDPETYLNNIRADGYATSLKYVSNLMRVISTWGLTKYDTIDKKEDNKMSNSSLVSYTKISPNKTSPRNHVIDTISIHCMAGNLSVETCGKLFAKSSKQASSNYGIGTDGRIALYVDEKDRSWCTSSASNDNRAITIEVANNGGAPDWPVSDAAMASLIKLCADICKRNGIKELKWQANKNLIGQVDKQNMTVHRWFAAKACPGNYLYNKHSYIASEVNKLLGVSTTTTPTTNNTDSNSSSNTYTTDFKVGDVIKLVEGATYYNGKKIPSWVMKSTLYYRGINNNGIIFSTRKTGAITGTVNPEMVISASGTSSSSTSSTTAYKVKITATALNVRKAPNTSSAIVTSVKKNQVYTIVDTQNNWGLLKSYQKNRNGWICLDYTQKV